jgi:hypothetical protein
MKCENAVDLIIDSLLDALDDEQRDDLEAHLKTCESCAAEFERIAALWNGLAQLRPLPAAARPTAGPASRAATARWYDRYAPALRAAAAIALIVLGGAGGFLLRGEGSPAAPAPADASTFLFLVRGEEPQGPLTGSQLVEEYRAWAVSLAQEGRLVGANKLTDEPGRWVADFAAAETRTWSDVSGYFVISASGYDEAIAIAEASPHIRYGGTFEIRQVDPVN